MDVFDLVAKISLDKSGFDGGLDSAKGALSSFGGAMKSGFATVAKVGAAAVGAATTAVGGFAASAVTAGASFDTSMAQVAATMGKTVDEITDLRDFAQEMGRTTAFSASQSADALNYMALAGYDAETSMAMLPNVLNLAAAGTMDLASASDMLTDTQSALGLSQERTNQLVDEMAKAASKSNTSVAQLGSAILTVGGTAKQLHGGLATLADGTQVAYDGTTELSAALGILADNGTKGAEGGTALRNVLTTLSGSKFAKTFGAMGVEVYDAAGEMRSMKDILSDMNSVMDGMTTEEKTGLINKTFNSRDLKNVNALLATSTERWDELTTSIKDSSGAAEQMAGTQLDNLNGDITLFKSALEGAQIAVSDELTPTLRKFVKFGTDGLSRMTSAFKDGDLSGAMAEFGTILSEGVGMVTKMLPDMINAGMELLSALGTGLIDNLPVLIDEVLPALLEAGGQLISGISTGISENINEILSAAGDIAEAIFNGLLEATSNGGGVILDVINAIVGAFTERSVFFMDTGAKIIINIVEGIINALPKLLSNVREILVNFGDVLIENLPVLLDAALNMVMLLMEQLISLLPQIVPQITALMLELVQFLIEAAPLLIDAAIQMVVALANGLIEALPELIPAVVEMIIAIVMALTDPTNLMQLMTAAVMLAMAILEGLLRAIPEILNAIPQLISNLVGALVAAVPEILAAAVLLFNAILTALIELIPQLVLAIPRLILAIVGGIKQGISAIANVGRDLVQGLWNGIKSRWQGLVNDFKNLATGLVDRIKGIFGIHSPSTVFAGIGKNIDEGMAIGITRNIKTVDDAMGMLTDYDTNFTVGTTGGSGGASVLSQVAATTQTARDLTVILELDKTQLAKAVYSLNNAETQRVGVRLAGGYA